MRLRLATLALATLTALGAAQATFAASELSDADAAKLLAEGKRVMEQGIPDVAISKYFDPVIAHYEAAQRPAGKRLYLSRSVTETLAYTMTAARQHVDAVVESSTTWVDALELKAYALVEMQRPAAAEKVLRRALELEPLYPVALAELGNIYQARKQWDKALDIFQQVASGAELVYAEGDEDRNRYIARGLRGQGFVLTEQGKLDESEALYKRCLELDPKDSNALGELDYIRQLRASKGAAGP